MFTNIIRLELAKQRKGFLSVMLFAAIFLLCVVAESLINNRNVIEVFGDIITVFAFVGMPLFLILTAPVAATQLRSESIRNSEEPLPFSPINKVFGTYLTNLLYALIGFFFFVGITLIFHPIPYVDSSFSLSLSDNQVLSVIILLLFQLHLFVFLFAYWINQAILGLAVAGLFIGSEVLILMQMELLKDRFWGAFSDSAWMTLVLSGIIIGFIGGILGLWIISKRVERNSRTFFLPGFITTVAASIGVLILGVSFFLCSYIWQNRLIPLFIGLQQQLVQSKPLQTGTFFYSASNDLIRVTPENQTVLRNTGFTTIPNEKPELIGYDTDGEASFLLFRKDSGKYEVWTETSNRKFEKYCSFFSKSIEPEYMFLKSNGISLYGFSGNENFAVFSKVSSQSTDDNALQWEKIPIAKNSLGLATIFDHVYSQEVQEGRAARLSGSKMVLTRVLPDKTILEWKLPGVAVIPKYRGSVIQPAYEKDGIPYFVIPVSENNKTSFVLCLPDGSIKSAWNDSWLSDDDVRSRSVMGAGAVWTHWQSNAVELRVINKDGTFYNPLTIPNEGYSAASPRKVEGSYLWFVRGRKFIKVDLSSGKTLFSVDALSGSESWNTFTFAPSKEGLYLSRDNRICLIDWNGKIRDLGPASVN